MKFEEINTFPKVELHCHLDGSLSSVALCKISQSENIRLPECDKQFAELLKAPQNCDGLAQYLRCFDTALEYLQTSTALTIAAHDLIRQAAEEHVVYIEVRFAPMLHGRRGLSCQQAIGAVLQGLKLGEKEYGVKSRAVLCMMRGQPYERNLEVLDAACELKNTGVGGIDLAGDESSYPPGRYQKLFCLSAKRDIPFTIHAGECGDAENVRVSVEMGARRIGHGVAIVKNPDILALCARHRVMLELCPTSNIQTKAAPSWDEYPFERLLRSGINISVNTDNRTVSDTTMTNELKRLTEYFPILDHTLMQRLTLAALDSAFLSTSEKIMLTHEINKGYDAYQDVNSCNGTHMV